VSAARQNPRQRVDLLLVERGLAESRSRAQALIEAGLVYSGDSLVEKPNRRIAVNAPLEVRGRDHSWVSRGGLKLAYALDHFGLDSNGLICLDVGASTGGFTDVLLQRGATKIYAVDVGRDQLADRLRHDPRVVDLQRTDARTLSPDLVADAVDFVVCDVSFIALEKALPAALALTRPGGWLIALVKPQFQAGPGFVGRGGIVRDPEVRARVCEQIRRWLEQEMDWRVLGLAESPITGADGNREFLIAAVNASP
jgi:23S rRNA (cytidine1920-2'-O)/16S rRNA (cytidine1409-2'-O)-methyltransferase